MSFFTSRCFLMTCATVLSVGVFLPVFFVDSGIYQVCNEDQKWFFLRMLPFIAFFILGWSLLSKRMTLSLTKTDCAVLLFIGYAIARYGTSDGSFAPIAVGGGLACLYVIFRLIFTRYPQVISLCLFSLLSAGIAEVIWGHLQLHGAVRSYHPLFRLTGTFFNPGPYSNYLASLLPIAIYRIVSYKKTGNDGGVAAGSRFGSERLILYASWVYAVCALTILPAARARIAWVAVAVTFVLILVEKTSVWTRIGTFRRRRPFCFYGILIGWVSVVAGLSWGMYQYKEKSVHGRLLIWKVGIHAVCERPLFGAGPGLYPGVYGEAQEAYFAEGEAGSQEIYVAGPPEYAFNDPLQITIEYGIVGLALFLFILGSAIWKLLPQKNGLAYGAISLFILMQASYPLNLIPFCILLTFFVAVSNQSDQRACPVGRLGVLLLSGCAFAGSVYVSRCYDRRYEALKDWQLIRPSYQMQGYKYVLHRYEALYGRLYDLPDFLFEYGNTLRATRRYRQSDYIFRQGLHYKGSALYCNMLGDNAKDQGNHELAEAYYEKSVDRIPNRITPLYLLAKLYFDTEQLDKARETVLRIRAFKPKIESLTVQNMRNDIERLVEAHGLDVPN